MSEVSFADDIFGEPSPHASGSRVTRRVTLLAAGAVAVAAAAAGARLLAQTFDLVPWRVNSLGLAVMGIAAAGVWLAMRTWRGRSAAIAALAAGGVLAFAEVAITVGPIIAAAAVAAPRLAGGDE